MQAEINKQFKEKRKAAKMNALNEDIKKAVSEYVEYMENRAANVFENQKTPSSSHSDLESEEQNYEEYVPGQKFDITLEEVL